MQLTSEMDSFLHASSIGHNQRFIYVEIYLSKSNVIITFLCSDTSILMSQVIKKQEYNGCAVKIPHSYIRGNRIAIEMPKTDCLTLKDKYCNDKL